jgi:hypothetical protein
VSLDLTALAMSLRPSMDGGVKMFVVWMLQHLRAQQVVRGRTGCVSYSLRNDLGTLGVWRLSFERWRTKAD